MRSTIVLGTAMLALAGCRTVTLKGPSDGTLCQGNIFSDAIVIAAKQGDPAFELKFNGLAVDRNGRWDVIREIAEISEQTRDGFIAGTYKLSQHDDIQNGAKVGLQLAWWLLQFEGATQSAAEAKAKPAPRAEAAAHPQIRKAFEDARAALEANIDKRAGTKDPDDILQFVISVRDLLRKAQEPDPNVKC